MILMTIGEVAAKSGLRASAIRYYEELGLLPAPQRLGGKRRYGTEVLERLSIVRFAQFVGFSLEEVKRLLEGVKDVPPPERWRAMAAGKIAEIGRVIARAKRVRGMLTNTLAHQCPRLVTRGDRLLKEHAQPLAKEGLRR